MQETNEQEAAVPSWKVGRLLDPNSSLGTDPRVDSRIAGILRKVGGADLPGELPVTPASPREELLGFAQAVEDGTNGMIAAVLEGRPATSSASEILTARGRDGNEITLYVHRPSGEVEGPLPTVVHMHGGGMVALSATSPVFNNWRNHLASAGVIAVGVEFRNAGGALGPHPFPASLHDCADAVRWIAHRRSELGVGKIILQGESGGGNLALATALLAKSEGWIAEVDGVYAQCPYIAGPDVYREPTDEFISLRENDGYVMGIGQMLVLSEVYDPRGDHASDPLCWPFQASTSDLEGLPPHVIDVDEVDPVRDEGIAYYRKLRAAGVPAVGRVLLGLPHAGDVFFGSEAPQIVEASIGSIAGFARSL